METHLPRAKLRRMGLGRERLMLTVILTHWAKVMVMH